jgi:hypothetical protein
VKAPMRLVPRMVAEPQNVKGPATAPNGPEPRFNTNPQKDTDMNDATNTTSEHPWEAARRHANDLSEALTGCNASNWYAHVFPSDRPYSVCFAAKPHPEDADEMAIDRVNRLAWELSKALDEYADGRFSARVYPSRHAGTSVLFMSIASERRTVE